MRRRSESGTGRNSTLLVRIATLDKMIKTIKECLVYI